jgi:uncharacterized protein YkwD
MRRVLMPLAAAALVLTGLVPSAPAQAEARTTAEACPAKATADPWFWDMSAKTPFAAQVSCLRFWGVTAGQADGSYRPRQHVTRSEMATFIARTIERSGGTLPKAARDYFSDDTSSPHQTSINALAAAGIVRGTGNGSVKPFESINRVEVAAMLGRAHDYRAAQDGATALPNGSDAFTDDNAYPLSREVNKAAAAGIVTGTGSGRFAPAQQVRRDHMAAVLTRLLAVHVTEGISTTPSSAPAGKRPVAPAPPAPKPAPSLLSTVEQSVLNEINSYRRSKGLRALAADPCLTEAARSWSSAMARAGRISHGKPSWCGNRSWAENVAYHHDAGQLFEAWRDSPGHRTNLLRGGATKMGVGIVAVRVGSGTRYYATTQSD